MCRKLKFLNYHDFFNHQRKYVKVEQAENVSEKSIGVGVESAKWLEYDFDSSYIKVNVDREGEVESGK